MNEILLAKLQRQGIQARVTGHTLWVCCPFCVLRGTTKDTKYRLGIELKGGKVPKGTAHCFNCNYPRGWSFARAQNTLQELLGSAFLAEDLPAKAKDEDGAAAAAVALPEDFEPLTGPEEYWTAKAWTYLLQRGMTGQQVRECNVGLSLLGKAAGRVVFPIYEDETLIGWTARSLVGANPKWLHSPQLRSPYWAAKAKMPALVVTEGVFDSLAVARVLYHSVDVVALLGTNLTEHKAKQIRVYKTIILWLDPDAAGRRATIALAGRLYEQSIQTEVVLVDPSKTKKLDPGELAPVEIEQAFRTRRVWTPKLAIKLRAQK